MSKYYKQLLIDKIIELRFKHSLLTRPSQAVACRDVMKDYSIDTLEDLLKEEQEDEHKEDS